MRNSLILPPKIRSMLQKFGGEVYLDFATRRVIGKGLGALKTIAIEKMHENQLSESPLGSEIGTETPSEEPINQRISTTQSDGESGMIEARTESVHSLD